MKMMRRLRRPHVTTTDSISLRDYMEAKFESMEKAIAAAKDALDVRLEGMNEFRKQISDQAANFMPRAEYLIQHNAVIEKIESLQALFNGLFERQEKRIRDIELIKSNIQGRVWATAVVVTAALVAVQVLLHVFMSK